jgi:hypothetical protein
MRVFPIGIPLSDPAVAAMNIKLRPLIARYITRTLNRLALRAKCAGSAGRTCLAHTPAAAIRDYMLTFTRHLKLLALSSIKDIVIEGFFQCKIEHGSSNCDWANAGRPAPKAGLLWPCSQLPRILVTLRLIH